MVPYHMKGAPTQQEVQPPLDSGHGLQGQSDRDKTPETIFRETSTQCNSSGNMAIKVLGTMPVGIFTEPLLADLVNDNVGFQISSKRESQVF